MSERKLSSVRARVTLTIELDGGSSWGADCSLSQVLSQAGDETVQRVINLFGDRLIKKHGHPEDVRIIGTPKVVALLGISEPE